MSSRSSLTMCMKFEASLGYTKSCLIINKQDPPQFEAVNDPAHFQHISVSCLCTCNFYLLVEPLGVTVEFSSAFRTEQTT